MINYKICDKERIKDVINFVKFIDNEFPIKLSNLVNIEDYIKKLITYGNVLVAKDKNKIVGICAGYMNDIEKYNAYISILGIDSEYRKLGIATGLVNVFIEKANKCGMKRIFLETHKENFSALNFYKKNEFIVLEDVKPNTEGSVILMRELDNRG